MYQFLVLHRCNYLWTSHYQGTGRWWNGCRICAFDL